MLHETELGDFKNVIKHLVRILHTQGADVVHEFNERYVNSSTGERRCSISSGSVKSRRLADLPSGGSRTTYLI